MIVSYLIILHLIKNISNFNKDLILSGHNIIMISSGLCCVPIDLFFFHRRDEIIFPDPWGRGLSLTTHVVMYNVIISLTQF